VFPAVLNLRAVGSLLLLTIAVPKPAPRTQRRGCLSWGEHPAPLFPSCHVTLLSDATIAQAFSLARGSTKAEVCWRVLPPELWTVGDKPVYLM